MNLKLTGKLQQADHWELIEELSKHLINSGESIRDFHDTLEHIGESRDMIAKEIAKVEVLKDAIRMKFSIMDTEWCKELAQAEEIIESQFDREFLSTNSVSSIPEGLI